jgi:hypothetical protein
MAVEVVVEVGIFPQALEEMAAEVRELQMPQLPRLELPIPEEVEVEAD